MISLLFVSEVFATHNRSGEITYQWIGPGLTYKIRVYTYTDPASSAADRCEQTVFIDGGLDSVNCPRVNGFGGSCSPATMGIIIPGHINGVQENIYEGIYAFTGAGTHTLTMTDPNRNANINNIIGSVNIPFALSTTIIIGNFPPLQYNNSPVLLNPPVDNACVNQLFIHNPAASDPDGDSLAFSLSTCLGAGGVPLPVSVYQTPSNTTINAITGDLIWNTPTAQGEYNFAILITEYRKDLDGNWVVMGKTLRDLQVLVVYCANQNPPVLATIADVCIFAGTNLTVNVSASDPNNDIITLTATGLPFVITPAATFVSTPAAGNVTGVFSWTPNCTQVRSNPYQVVIKAADNGSPVNLVDFKSFFVRVVAPPPTGLNVTPFGTAMVLNWTAPNCTQTVGNVPLYFLIYRKNDCSPFTPDPCGNNNPSTAGFTLIGTTNYSVTTFTDNNGGSGLSQGVNYSYVVVVQFADGTLSAASASECEKLNQDLPLLINVSVDTTDLSLGQIYVRWVKPYLGAGALDTVLNPGPYQFRLWQATGLNSGTYSQIYTVTKTFFADINQLSDTTFTSTALNTETNPYHYKIEFYSNNILKGETQSASSVRLSAVPQARKVLLSWTHQVPWVNSKYYIYRQVPPGLTYVLRDSTSALSYTDTNCVNGVNYCYRVLSKGNYSNPSIYSPLLNWSQKTCATPQDNEVPCSPSISASGDCFTGITQLVWNNPNNSCSDDIVTYYLYFTDNNNNPPVLIDSITNANDTIYVTDFAASIAGCYSIAAVDSFGNQSSLSVESCVDNCPEYELPNIITLNGDNINDFFIPVKNKYIESIDIYIYNRWGTLLFNTEDPQINWDGKDKFSKKQVSDGTYYYICEVNAIHYDGIRKRKLKGFFQVISSK